MTLFCMILKRSAFMWESTPKNMSQTYVRRARCSTDAPAAGGWQTAKTQSVLTLKLQCDTGLPAASLLPLQHAARLGTISSSPLIPTQDMMTGSTCHCHTHNRCLVLCLCPYLVLVGFFQRLDFFLVFVVLGVESINDLQEENRI